MENLKLEISEQQIRDYLKKYQNYYKDCGTLFVKYLKDNTNNPTEEMIEILTEGKITINNSGEISSFNPIPTYIEKLDLSGICHILIPTIKYYGESIITIDQLYWNLENAAEKLSVSINHPLDVVISTIDDYQICEKVKLEDQILKIKMSRESCRRELFVYQNFYDKDKVKQIRKIVRERV